MAGFKLRRILSKRKPLRGILDAFTENHAVECRIEAEDGKLLYGSETAHGETVEIIVDDTCVGRIISVGNALKIQTIIDRYLELEIEKRSLANEVLDRYRELNLLYDVAEKMTECQDIPSIGKLILDEAHKVAPSTWGRVFLVDGEHTRSVAEHGTSETIDEVPLLDQVLDSGISGILDDHGEDRRHRSWVAAPIKSRSGVLGVLVLGAKGVRAYDSGSMKLVTSLAGQAAPAIESARLTQKQRDLAKSFARFVPDEFLGALKHTSVTEVDTGEHAHKDMSVFFSDIRAFTTLVEGKAPEESYRFINEYLSRMEPGIRANEGFVAEVVGDAIMALFDDGGADNAVRAAIACQTDLKEYNRERQARGERVVTSGIGISSGELMLGTIGSPERIKCGVIGDTVNTAARVEGLTKLYGADILITNHTRDRLENPDVYHTRPVDRVRAKGKTKPMVLYEVMDALPEAVRTLRYDSHEMFMTGWKLYQAGEPSDALVAFADAMRIDSSDRLTRLYLGRCWQLLENGIPEEWDGITDMRVK